MKKQQKITIRIADVGSFGMNIDADSEEVVRVAEKSVNKVWNAWRNEFSEKSNKEILAMVTFQFAKLYYQLLEQVKRQQTLIDDFESELNRLLDLPDEPRPQGAD